MKAELERLQKETGWGTEPEVKLPAVAAEPEAVLVLTFDADEGDRAVDSSGKDNHGQVQGAALADGRQGKARRFDGKSYITVPKAAGMDPSMKPLTVSAVVKPEQPKGVILARGGQTQGFALYLDEGRPVFAVRSSGDVAVVRADRQVGGDWVELTGMLTRDLRLVLYVNGEKVAEGKASWFLSTDPNEGLEIGQDRGTKVGLYEGENGFVGLMEEVRVYTGEKPPGAR